MDIRQLRYFVEVAAHANFNRAAERLMVAQSALSRQIRKLEDELGVELFSPVGRGVVLTRAGELMAEHASFILNQVERTREAVVAEATVPQGTAALGAPPSVSNLLFGPLAQEYTALFPGVTLRLVDGMNRSVLDWLRVGHIDLGVIALPDPDHPESFDKDVALAKITVEDMVVFGPKNDTRLRRECSVEELQHLPLILPGPSHMSRRILERAASDKSVRIHTRLEVESLQVIKELVLRGMGYGVVPGIGLQPEIDSFTVSAIRGLRLVRAVAHRADRPPSAAVVHLLRLACTMLDNLPAFAALRSPLSAETGQG